MSLLPILCWGNLFKIIIKSNLKGKVKYSTLKRPWLASEWCVEGARSLSASWPSVRWPMRWGIFCATFLWTLGLLEQHQAESHLPLSQGSCLLKSSAKYWASGLLSILGCKQIVPFRSAQGQCFSNFSHSCTNFMVLAISILFTQYFYKALFCFLKYIYFKRKLHITLNGKTSITQKTEGNCRPETGPHQKNQNIQPCASDEESQCLLNACPSWQSSAWSIYVTLFSKPRVFNNLRALFKSLLIIKLINSTIWNGKPQTSFWGWVVFSST